MVTQLWVVYVSLKAGAGHYRRLKTCKYRFDGQPSDGAVLTHFRRQPEANIVRQAQAFRYES